MNQVLIRVAWLTAAQGGRRALPAGPDFTTVVRFDHQPIESWMRNAHSLRLVWLDQADSGSWYALASFLNPDGAPNWLLPGSSFDLCDGPRPVARASVLSPSTVVDRIRTLAA